MRNIRSKKNHFEPANSSLLESGFDGQVGMLYIVRPAVQANFGNNGHAVSYDMDDFSEQHETFCNCDDCANKVTDVNGFGF